MMSMSMNVITRYITEVTPLELHHRKGLRIVILPLGGHPFGDVQVAYMSPVDDKAALPHLLVAVACKHQNCFRSALMYSRL